MRLEVVSMTPLAVILVLALCLLVGFLAQVIAAYILRGLSWIVRRRRG
jgi:hypothetical protein